MILWNILVLNLLILLCSAAPSSPTTAPTPQPVLQIAQKLLSNIGRFPTAIQEGMTGKTGEIRKIVSSALGGGLIGQLVENPIQAAGNFGFDLDQFGINKTMLENSMGLNADKAWQSNLLPTTINKGDLLFSNNQINAAPTTPAGPEPLYIDGKKVMPENEDAVLNGIFGGERNNLKQVQPQKGRKLESAQYYGNEKSHMRWQENRPTPNAFITDSHAQNIPTPRYQNLPLQPQPPPPPVSPAPPSDSVDSANSIINSVMPFINTPQMPTFNNEINDENRAVAHAINRVALGDAEIRRVPMARAPEMHKMNAKILSLEQRLNEQQELLAKQHGEEKELKVQKILETLKFGKGNRLSALQKHLRYSPEAVNDDLRLDTHPLKHLSQIQCECENVSLKQLKGSWVQALASESLISQLNKGIESIFDSKNAKLECAEITITPPRDYNPEYSHFVLGIRMQNATNVVRLPGNIFPGQNNQFTMRLIDFDNQINDIPFCIHKTDINSRYLVIAESTNCQAATLLVKNPEQFFKTTDTNLTNYLKKKISSNQMDRMELVEHVNVCSS
uniref:Uncharacterized protein n=1 Tax=Panagrolaimus sp. PS1159 TaxID=55785 RepID=A0AC35EVL7_9BILA